MGYCRIANLLVPPRHRQLRRENQRPGLIPVLANLPEVPTLRFGQRGHGPIFDHQGIGPAQSRQQIAETSVGPRQRQFPEQRRRLYVEGRIPVAARFLGEGLLIAFSLESLIGFAPE